MRYDKQFITDLRKNQTVSGDISFQTVQIDDEFSQVIEVTTPLSLNKVVATWREYQQAKTFFRGQRNFHQAIPLSGFDRNNIPDLNNLLDPEKTLEFILASSSLSVIERGMPRSDFWNSLDKLALSKNRINGLGGGSKYTERKIPQYALEGLLQQYIGHTRWIDVVDNLHVALWMATREYSDSKIESSDKEKCYKPVCVSAVTADIDSYIYLYLYSFKTSKTIDLGLYQSDDSLLLDLREALPSRYLRPHSQHAMLIRNYPSADTTKESSSTTNIAAIRMTPKLALEIVGNSSIINNETIFPSDDNDIGLKNLSSTLVNEWTYVQPNPEDRISESQFIPKYISQI